MMFTTRDTEGHTQICLTSIFKVTHQGQVTDFGFSEILDIVNVRIDTKIKSVVCIQPELRKVISWMCVTLSSKVNRQGHGPVFFSTFLISLTSKMLESNQYQLRIMFTTGDMKGHATKCLTLIFQGHAIKIEFFHYHRWIPWPIEHTHDKYSPKIQTGRQKSMGWWYSPPGVFGGWNTVGVCGLNNVYTGQKWFLTVI